jgi:signal transduction histidine kinase
MTENRGLSRGLTIGMAIVVVLAIAQLGVAEYSYRKGTESRERALAVAKSELALESVLRNLADAQTSQLEFLLTGRNNHYSRYQTSRNRILPTLDNLLTSDTDASLSESVKPLREMAKGEIDGMDATIALFQRGQMAEVRQRVEASAAGESMPKLREELAKLAARQQARNEDTASEWRQIRELGRGLLILLTISVVAMFLWVFRSAQNEAGRIVSQKEKVEDDKERLESMVRVRTAELSELTSYLHKVREDERRSLARELHDELGSILTAAKLDIAFIKSRCAQSNPELVPKCDRIAEMIDQGTALKRRIIDNLRPSTLDMLGLAPAARDLVESFAAESRITVDTEIDEEIVLRNDDALALYRIIQEALANVRQHADASKVSVGLTREGDLIHALVRDDGKGFDPVALPRSGGHGLSAMRQRIRALGGKFAVNSAPGNGATVDVWLPYRPD